MSNKFTTKKIKHKPISLKELGILRSLNNPFAEIILNTGARINEVRNMVEKWELNSSKTYIDVETKKSEGYENRFYLNKRAIKALNRLKPQMFGKSIRTYNSRYADLSREAGFKFTSHNLRATFATILMMNGVDLVSIQTLMNHADINQTAAYIQFVELHLRTGVDSINELPVFEGMTVSELKHEILRLRKRLHRYETVYKVKDTIQYVSSMLKEFPEIEEHIKTLKNSEDIENLHFVKEYWTDVKPTIKLENYAKN